MNRERARKKVRRAIKSYANFLRQCGEVEFEIFGGFFDIVTENTVEKVTNALQPENLEAFREEHKNDRYSLDDILMGAASGASEEEINSNEWIDGVIAEIQDNFKGCPFQDANDDIQIYEGNEDDQEK